MPETQLEARSTQHLKRVLGRRDLVLLFVVAIVNLNVLPTIAGNGPVTIWLWLLALLFFFWPQGIAVTELAYRYPEEGGVYLWTKKVFGDFHGFLSGWCYWTNNVFYVPTVVLTFVGVSVYLFGAGSIGLADNKTFTFFAALILLWLLAAANMRGLGVGKWVNNIGGIGTATAAVVLIALGLTVLRRYGTSLHANDFKIASADWHVVSSFGFICFGLVGLELASIMGDEIKDPRKTLPSAIAWGGIISGLFYMGATLTLLTALPQNKIGVLQGIMEAVTSMSAQTGVAWLVVPLAFVLSVSIAGIASAWLGGSARIPFVAGLDRYLPSALGKMHSRWATPHIALLVHATLSTLFLAMSFVGAQVREAYITMLDLAVVLQLVPFLYMYAALIRLSTDPDQRGSYYKPWTLKLAGTSGFLTTVLAMAVGFVPSHQITSILAFEAKMVLGTMFFLGLAGFFFFIYGRRKMPQALASRV